MGMNIWTNGANIICSTMTLLHGIGYICQLKTHTHVEFVKYMVADKSLSRPGRKQAIATEDFEFRISYL
jgi:hypothetical protein